MHLETDRNTLLEEWTFRGNKKFKARTLRWMGCQASFSISTKKGFIICGCVSGVMRPAPE